MPRHVCGSCDKYLVDENGVALIHNDESKKETSNDQKSSNEKDDTDVAQPARKKRKKAKSFITANGTENEPTQFFLPK